MNDANNKDDGEPTEIGAFLSLLGPALVGTSVPTLTSGTTKIYDLEITIDILKESTEMNHLEILKCIRNLNNTYVGTQNPIFVTDDEDLRDQLGFQL